MCDTLCVCVRIVYNNALYVEQCTLALRLYVYRIWYAVEMRMDKMIVLTGSVRSMILQYLSFKFLPHHAY